MNMAIADISTATQKIAANAEESSAASEELLSCCDQSMSHVQGMVALVRGKNGTVGQALAGGGKKAKHHDAEERVGGMIYPCVA
jgi:hypothetical protein